MTDSLLISTIKSVGNDGPRFLKIHENLPLIAYAPYHGRSRSNLKHKDGFIPEAKVARSYSAKGKKRMRNKSTTQSPKPQDV